MRQLLYTITFTLISLSCLSQRADTFFLKRNTYIDTLYNISAYHAIYIDNNYSRGGLKSLADFSFGEFDSTTYFEGLKQLKKSKLQKNNLNKEFPRKWVALYLYKEEFFTYYPSDFGNHYKFQITDTTTLDFTMEGPEPSILLSTRQIASNKVELTRNNYWKGHKLTINIIDSAKGIAIFTFSPTKYIPYVHKVLMVNADKAYLFKTVVNYCETQKMFEFEFDKIDFEQLEKNGSFFPGFSQK